MELELLKWIGVFGISLFALIKFSDLFTDSAEKIGLMLGIPSFIVGVTIVSIGTSLPELVTSLIAVAENSSEIVPGNIIGSNIANICLILGVGAVLGKELKISFDIANIDLPILVGSAFLLSFLMWMGGISQAEAVVLIIGFFIYFFYTLSHEARSNQDIAAEEEKKPDFDPKPIIFVLIGAVGIFFGAKYTIESVEQLSAILKIGKEIIAVSAVALGTSLPELAVTLSAVKKKNHEMIIGNVLGSNIFNTFAVAGFPGIIKGLKVPNSLIEVSIPIFLIATIVFYVAAKDRKITRWEGWLFLLLYALSIGKTFGLV